MKRDFLIDISYRLSFFFNFLHIFFTVSAFFFLSRFIDAGAPARLEPYGGNYFPFVLTGIAFSNYFNVFLNAFSSPLREAQQQGTLEAVIATPTPLFVILAYSCLYQVLYTLFEMAIYFILGILVFNMSFAKANYFGAILIFLLSTLSFAGLGLISGSFVLVYKRGNPVNWVLSSVSWLLSGTLYPVSVLPVWLQNIALVLPLTHTLQAVRLALLQGAPTKDIAFNLLALVLFSAVILPLAVVFFLFAANKVRKEGGLAHY